MFSQTVAVQTHLPLAGVRVIDLSSFLSGPMATHTLGELGADVIKVEPPGGDPTRAGTGLTPDAAPSPFWTALHRDRRSVVPDLKQPAGVQALRDLVVAADVLVENFRPGVTARLGIGPEELLTANPRLIYCTITGYGSDGPGAARAATDGPIQASTGVLELSGAPVPFTVADLTGAATAAQAVLAALFARERSGRGCYIDLSLAECLMQWLGVTDRTGTLSPPITLVMDCSDGGTVLVQTPMHFRARLLALLAETPGGAAFVGDGRWTTLEGARLHLADYMAGVRRAFATKTMAEWLALLDDAGIPAAPVRTLADALDDPQARHRGSAGWVELPGGERVRVVRGPFVVDGRRRESTSAPPTLGEGTEEILRTVAGYDDVQLAAARDAGAW
jgi:crotonobetainyl-CoA:carnitine CoA-transferase CaiB-like acyl-CoA transferase